MPLLYNSARDSISQLFRVVRDNTLKIFKMAMSIRPLVLVLLVISYGSTAKVFNLGKNGHQYTLKIFVDTFIVIECEKNAIHIEELPRSVTTKKSMLTVKDCQLPKESLQTVVETLGARIVDDIKLVDVPLLKREHLSLVSVERILVINSGVATDALEQQSLLTNVNILNSNLNLTEISFGGLTNLEFLELKECHISHIPRNMFKDTPKLKKLKLAKNFIAEVTTSYFEGLSSLQYLDLSENLLTSLPEDFLHFLPSLKKLYLDKNPIRELSTNTLRGSNLAELTIKDNTVPLTAAPRALAEMPDLTYVRLINCSITTLPVDLLEGSNTVDAIDLSFNQIQDIPKNFFENKNRLDKLNLDNNRLSVLSPDTFAHLPNLRILHLDHNTISILTAGILYMDKLKFLWMRNNGLQVVSSQAFPASLVYVNLDHNKLRTLETTVLSALHQLFLMNNLFSNVPASWRDTFPALARVNLRNNAFTQLKESDLAAVPQIIELDLTDNKISTVDVGENTTLPEWLWLRRAPLCCDCHLNAFATLFEDNKADTSAVCAKPVSLKGRKLMDVIPEELVCSLESCPNTCKCVVSPATKALEVECREQLTEEQVTELENLRRQHYSGLTQKTTVKYNSF